MPPLPKTVVGLPLRSALAKITDRWPSSEERTPPLLFDEDCPQEEQIPRLLEIEVFERPVGGKLYVFQRCNGINMGDRLTDNIMRPDDYRFHDVFHYAYAAVLGWSPGCGLADGVERTVRFFRMLSDR